MIWDIAPKGVHGSGATPRSSPPHGNSLPADGSTRSMTDSVGASGALRVARARSLARAGQLPEELHRLEFLGPVGFEPTTKGFTRSRCFHQAWTISSPAHSTCGWVRDARAC